jgi:hypothetical protein
MIFWFAFIATHVCMLCVVGTWVWGMFEMLRFGVLRGTGRQPDQWAFLRRWPLIVALFGLSGLAGTISSGLLNELTCRTNL